MSEHLLINPNELYKLYYHTNVIDYYPFSFLPKFTSIEIDIFYDILNTLETKQIENLNCYLYKQWSLTRKLIETSDKETTKRKKKIMTHKYNDSKCNTKEQLNVKLSKFIKKDKTVSLYVMNKLLKFLHPC